MSQQPQWGQAQPQQGQPQYAPQPQQAPQYAPAPQQGQPQYAPQPQQGGWAQQTGYAPPQQQAAEVTMSADDFLGAAERGAPTFYWGENGDPNNVGRVAGGTITEISAPRQQTNITDGSLKWYPARPGQAPQPMLQVAITLQTHHRNWEAVKPANIPTGPDGQPKQASEDDGLRRIYVKNLMTPAFRKAAGILGRPARVGDKIGVRLTGYVPPKNGVGYPSADYEVMLEGAQASDALLGAPAQQQAPAQAGPPAFAQSAPVMSTAAGQPVVHQQQLPPEPPGYQQMQEPSQSHTQPPPTAPQYEAPNF